MTEEQYKKARILKENLGMVERYKYRLRKISSKVNFFKIQEGVEMDVDIEYLRETLTEYFNTLDILEEKLQTEFNEL